jgi:hypothetical protein
MPKPNALAPKPLNQLGKLLAETAKYPQYGEMVDYLTQREMMPPINQVYLSSGTNGRFRQNVWDSTHLPKTGLIEVKYGAGPSTVLHELAHATDEQVSRDYRKLKLLGLNFTPEEKRFMTAYEKLSYNPKAYRNDPAKYPRRHLANKLSPEWAKEESDYRSRDNELAGWGMGSTVQRDTEYNPPLHLDPTMATELLILTDLARRVSKK